LSAIPSDWAYVKLVYHPHEDADRIITQERRWPELIGALSAITDVDIVARHQTYPKPPAGAQTALNEIIKERLAAFGWEPEPRLFEPGDGPEWAMDFHDRSAIGVEVVFNHNSYSPLILNKLLLARRYEGVKASSRIRIGVVVAATKRLKKWGRMDGSVATFESFRDTWLPYLGPIVTMPVMLIGLDAEHGDNVWDLEGGDFRGTVSGIKDAGLERLVSDGDDSESDAIELHGEDAETSPQPTLDDA